MRRGRKSYALQLRDELTKGSNVVPGNDAAAQTPIVTNAVAVAPKGTGLGSLIASTQRKVETEMPPLTYEEAFRGKQDTLNGILRILIYENEFTELVKRGQMTQAIFDQLKAAALQAYKMWPKEIYAAMLAYQKSRQPVNSPAK